MANLNPLEIQITKLKIKKFNGNDEISILPQFVELSIYQSIFEPVMKAELLVNDNIGLFVNYPFTGEEILNIEYQQNAGLSITELETGNFQFIIKGVRDIALDDRARGMMYIVDLVSVEFLQNVRKLVSHAFNDLVEDMAEKVYNEYILEDTQKKFIKTKTFIKEESLKIRNMVIPNLRPFQAIQWLAKQAVAKDYEKHFLYLFYENNEGFNFVTIQKLIEDAWKQRKEIKDKKYKYVSDVETALGDKIANQDDILYYISNIINNKRFSSIEKIAGGYYQNELFEISLLQKSYNSQPTELEKETGENHLEKYPLNTDSYIDYVKNEKNEKEYSNRIRYIINNFEDLSDENKTQPQFRYKFGNATKYMYALNQMDYTITVPANMKLKAGQIIYCDIPEMHGFNDVRPDKYVSGFFIITEVKQVMSAGNRVATSLRINKDGYLEKLNENSDYNTINGTLQ
jgi:hypothetical protein